MTRKLSEFKISDWVLTVDLLGTKQRMSEADWIDALKELLDTILVSVNQSMASKLTGKDLKVFQYGDAITFAHDDVEELICLGIRLQEELFGKDILAQFGLSGWGIYNLDDTTAHRLVKKKPEFKLQSIVGRGLARSHLLLHGIKGPRFIIDEESHIPAKGKCWEKFIDGCPLKRYLSRSELRWWKNIPNIKKVTSGRISNLEKEIGAEKANKTHKSYRDRDTKRRIESLKKRLEHYKVFLDVLNWDSEL